MNFRRLLCIFAAAGTYFSANYALAQAPAFPQTLPPNTVVGRLGVGAGPAEAIPFSKFQNGISGNLGAGTFYGNPGASTAAISPWRIQDQSSIGTPDKSADLLPIYDHATGAIKSVQPSALLDSICSTASNFLWNSAGTWVCQTTSEVSQLLGLPISITAYSPGGTSNDTVGVQAAYTACAALGGCTLTCNSNVVYTIDPITVGSNTTTQGCNFQQRVTSNRMFNIDGVTNVKFIGNRFVGNTVTSGLPAPVANDTPLWVTDSSNIWSEKNYFTKFGLYEIRAKNSSNIFINNNYSFGVAFGPRILCSNNVHIDSNTYIQTSLYSLTPTADQVAMGPMIDTDPCGNNRLVTITNNVLEHYPYSQAYQVHSGDYITIANNVARDASICVGMNTFAASDSISRVTVTGNVCEGSTVPLPSDSDIGITVLGVPGAIPTWVTISGNTLIGYNANNPTAADGCIVVSSANYVTVSGNTLSNCTANGMGLFGTINGITISGNLIANVTTYSSTSNGVLIATGSTINGTFMGNHFNSMSTNINAVGSATDIKYLTFNGCKTVTTCN